MTDAAKVPAFTKGDEAPIIFFENAPFVAQANGIYGVTLSAAVHVGIKEEQIHANNRIVAHLRGNAEAFKILRDSIDKLLLFGSKTEGQPN